VRDDLRAAADLVSGEAGRSLRAVLFSPAFSSDERRAVLAEILPRLGLGKLVVDALGLLNDKGRLHLLPAVARAYGSLADRRAGRMPVVVRTARPLSDALTAEIRDALAAATGATVVLDCRVDERLLGGLVCEVGAKVYDASLRSRLDAVRLTLLNAQEPAVA
jgi:F-type H+-transporting ATPase subunit delta